MNKNFYDEAKTLCIAIPTFNRAIRLEKALTDLSEHIFHAKGKKRISVYVSNNGSTDSTKEVLNKYLDYFSEHGIPYIFDNIPHNAGFDANVLNCYYKATGSYVWFLADDDNLESGSIDSILEDIDRDEPAVIYYNFGQEPYTYRSPYISENYFCTKIDEKNIDAVAKIVHYPKLTSVVLRRDLKNVGSKVKESCSVEISRSYGYIHCALVIQTAFESGRVLLSNKFIAFSDPDYMDHIDFPPYVGRELVEIIDILLTANGRRSLEKSFNLNLADPLTTSMNTLATYYRGKILLTPELKSELEYAVKVNFSIKKVFSINFIMHSLRLIFGITYSSALRFFLGKSITRLKNRSESYET